MGEVHEAFARVFIKGAFDGLGSITLAFEGREPALVKVVDGVIYGLHSAAELVGNRGGKPALLLEFAEERPMPKAEKDASKLEVKAASQVDA